MYYQGALHIHISKQVNKYIHTCRAVIDVLTLNLLRSGV